MFAWKNLESLLFCCCLAAVVSCNQQEEIPTDIMQRSEFIELLTEIQVFEAAYKVKIDRHQENLNIREANLWLLNEKGVDTALFRSSFDYYSSNPIEFEQILDEVIIRISEKEAELH